MHRMHRGGLYNTGRHFAGSRPALGPLLRINYGSLCTSLDLPFRSLVVKPRRLFLFPEFLSSILKTLLRVCAFAPLRENLAGSGLEQFDRGEVSPEIAAILGGKGIGLCGGMSCNQEVRKDSGARPSFVAIGAEDFSGKK